MNRWQKIAWYNVFVIIFTFILTGLCVGVLTIKHGMPKALSGLGMLGMLGLLGLSGFIFKKKKHNVEFDERDRLIFYRSIQITFAIFWPLFTAACMIPWFIIGPNNLIPINVLPLMLVAIAISLIAAQSIAVLVQYGRGEKDGQ
ncbi:MAG TPA: hypothetical protein HPP87_04000 [Planctomycetes bacterium]|nr:hypothetical protein [Planctomycetota bacterium]